MNLIYCIITAALDCNENRHAQKVISELGINYQHSVPQSINDSWEFWNCENVPDELPKFIKTFDCNPMDRIGFGLNQEDAEAIRDYKK